MLFVREVDTSYTQKLLAALKDCCGCSNAAFKPWLTFINLPNPNSDYQPTSGHLILS